MENMQNQENMDLMTEEDLQAAAPSSLWKDAWKRFYKNKTAVVALVVLTLMALAAILAEVIAPYDPIPNPQSPYNNNLFIFIID